MNKIVIDIETSNTFSEVGRDNFDALNISLIGLYSYSQDEFFSFGENEIFQAGEILKNASKIVGFGINRFDLPVLKRYFDFDIFSVSRFDILDEIEYLCGKRISLDLLAKANLGIGKNGKSLEAADLYRQGKMEELKNYCLNDVKITKDLYNLILKQGHLSVPRWNKEPVKILFDNLY